MSTRTALDKDLIMRRVSDRLLHQAHPPTPPATDRDANVHLPHESDVHTTSAVFSDVFSRVESGFDHFRTVTHDHNSRLAAMSAVDKEVDATRRLLHSLLARRNALAPISLLPPEILARVFHLLALDEPPFSSEESSGWIRTTHVCRHWRQVALGDSSLWARILRIGYDLNSSLISEMLARAKNAPLEVDINIIDAIPNPMHLFPPHLSHTRVLRLHGLTKPDCEDVREVFSQEAPVLEHFELGFFSASYPISFQDLDGTTPFKGQAPKLRSFCISHFCVPWSLIPRGQLTQLKIILVAEMSNKDPPSLGNAGQFIELLVNCPALEILVLELCLPSDLPQSSQGRTVQLPHLSRLCVRDSSFGVTNLLKMLRLPPNTTLHLYCVSEYGSSHNDYHVLPVVSAQFQASFPVEFKSLKVSESLGHIRNALRIVASTSFLPSIVRSSREVEADMDGEAEFVLSLDGMAEVSHWREILERACKILPISNLEFLSIDTPDTVNSTNWAELFKRCTSVTTIQAIGRGTSAFIRDLTPPNTKQGKIKKHDDSGTSAIPMPGSFIFPSLTSLSLEYLDFNELKYRSGVLFDVLANGLRRRNSTCDVPIGKFRVDHCVISVKQANALKKLVAEFHWDREEGLVNAFDEFEDFEDYDSDFGEPGAHWEDVFVGPTHDELENYPDEW